MKRLERLFNQHPVFFLTVCTAHRCKFLANSEIMEAFRQFAEQAETHGVYPGKFVLMPDHLHLFAAFDPQGITVSAWMKSLKNCLSKTLRKNGQPAPHWQKGFFDHLMRSGESYSQKWEYVADNPVRAGLVEKRADWPYQGEIFRLGID